jgi:hypothetical protein
MNVGEDARFVLELEFIQCLASPQYLNCECGNPFSAHKLVHHLPVNRVYDCGCTTVVDLVVCVRAATWAMAPTKAAHLFRPEVCCSCSGCCSKTRADAKPRSLGAPNQLLSVISRCLALCSDEWK